jgi:ADP-ribose pyrophosphatase
MDKSYTLKKLTREKWLNLFEIQYRHPGMDAPHRWLMCSRKDNPITDAAAPDAVVIVPVLNTPDGPRLVLTKEYRVPIADYEVGFPAGLIDEGETVEATVRRELKEETGLDVVKIQHISPPVYTSAGMTDESVCMVLLEAAGAPSDEHTGKHEDIEVILMDADDVRTLLKSGKKIAAKAWGLLYHVAVTGNIGFSDIP